MGAAKSYVVQYAQQIAKNTLAAQVYMQPLILYVTVVNSGRPPREKYILHVLSTAQCRVLATWRLQWSIFFQVSACMSSCILTASSSDLPIHFSSR
jgi:hypothetical protein